MKMPNPELIGEKDFYTPLYGEYTNVILDTKIYIQHRFHGSHGTKLRFRLQEDMSVFANF